MESPKELILNSLNILQEVFENIGKKNHKSKKIPTKLTHARDFAAELLTQKEKNPEEKHKGIISEYHKQRNDGFGKRSLENI
jgi:hypothetical protein